MRGGPSGFGDHEATKVTEGSRLFLCGLQQAIQNVYRRRGFGKPGLVFCVAAAWRGRPVAELVDTHFGASEQVDTHSFGRSN